MDCGAECSRMTKPRCWCRLRIISNVFENAQNSDPLRAATQANQVL